MTIRYHFSLKRFCLVCALQIICTAAEIRNYADYLLLSGSSGNSAEYMMLSFGHAPFICLIGAASVLVLMKTRSSSDLLLISRFCRREQYYNCRLRDGFFMVLGWVCISIFIRCVAERIMGYRMTEPFAYFTEYELCDTKTLYLFFFQMVLGVLSYLTAILWTREIVQDYTDNSIVRNGVSLGIAVLGLSVYRSLLPSLLSWIPLGNALLIGSHAGNIPGMLIYWAFLLFALYYVKTEIASRRELSHEWAEK